MRWTVAVMLAGILSVGCDDPLREAVIEALGDEAPGFEPSAIHRPGQPCLACHSPYEGAEPEMSIGGTLFYVPKDDTPPFVVSGYVVRLFDSEGVSFDVKANGCGNFYVEKSLFDPAFPIRATLYEETGNESNPLNQVQVMASRIGRDGSCARCHMHPKSAFSPGVVFVPGEDANFEQPAGGLCPPPFLGPNPYKPDIQ